MISAVVNAQDQDKGFERVISGDATLKDQTTRQPGESPFETGYAFMLRSALIRFGSLTHKLTAKLTVEAELIATSYRAKESVCLLNRLKRVSLGGQFESIQLR